jgi:hypothetical protein
MHRTVAVKVLRHSTRTAELVFNEVDLMLSFNHPNVVRALHVINWRHKRKGTGDDSLPPEASAGAAERDPTYPADVSVGCWVRIAWKPIPSKTPSTAVRIDCYRMDKQELFCTSYGTTKLVG